MSRLQADGVVTRYGDFQALFGVDLNVDRGETLALIGTNGAGKSTLLRTLLGLSAPSAGDIRLNGESIAGWPTHRIVSRGLALVPEGRRLFPSLSVEDNLRMGAQSGRRGPWTLERIYTLFPVLREFRTRPATLLSGGQQQMVAIGRALMSNPEVLLCDELSLGLAPIVVKDIYAAFPQIRADGMSIVLVEQDIGQALAVADRVVCLQEGRVTLAGAPATLTRAQISQAYFGV